jgi:hypothetical protein
MPLHEPPCHFCRDHFQDPVGFWAPYLTMSLPQDEIGIFVWLGPAGRVLSMVQNDTKHIYIPNQYNRFHISHDSWSLDIFCIQGSSWSSLVGWRIWSLSMDMDKDTNTNRHIQIWMQYMGIWCMDTVWIITPN